MSLNVTFNGAMYIIPETGEVGWGGNTTSYLVAIAAGALQKTGGSFTLSSEIDFGASFGIKSLYYKSRSANIAAAGILRLNNNSDSINWRNAANSADLSLFPNASNLLTFNGSTVYVIGAGTITNADIAPGAGIVYSKLNLTNSIVNADVNTSAAIAYSKLNLSLSIVNADINAAAAIAYSKLNLSNSIVNADINAAAAIVYSKLTLTNSIVNADVNATAAIAFTKMAAMTASRMTVSDISGFLVASAWGYDASNNLTTGVQDELRFQDAAGGDYVAFRAPASVTTHTYDLPIAPGTAGQVLSWQTGGQLQWINAAGGGTINTGNAGFFSYYPALGTTLDDQTVMSTNGTTQVYFIDGSVAVPSISFASDTDTGFRRQASGIVDYISNGAVLATLATNSFQITGGTAAIPGLTFIVDSDTGIYRTAANSLGVTLGGVKNLDMTSSVSTIQSSLTFGTARVSGFSGTPTTGGTIPANTYYYKVFALNANSYIGIPSDEIVVVVGGPNNKVDLSWTAVTDAVSYRIQRGTDQGGGAGYWVTSGITFSDSGQAFDFPGQNPVQAANQFKIELPGTVDLTASQGAIRWRDYINSNLVTGSISCTSAGEMEFFTSNGVVSGMYLFGKQGDGHPIHLDVRFATPLINFNSTQGDIKAGGVTGLTVFAAGTPTGAQTPNGLGISDGSVSLPGMYFINDTDTGFYRSASNQILVSLGGIQSLLFDTGKVQGLVATASSPTFSFIADPNTGMYQVGADDLGFSTGGTLRFDISTTAVTSTLPLLAPNGSAAAPSHSFSTDTDTGMFRANANEIQFAAGGTTTFQIETNDVQIISGTAAIPAYSFINDPDTGIYVAAANDLAFSTGGTLRLDISTTNVTSTLPFLAPNGTAGAPSHSFANDTDTGMFRANANEIQFAAGGTTIFQIETNSLQSIDGTVSLPAYSFINDSDCGMYRIGANSIGLATNGTRALAINSSQAVAIRGTSTNDSPTAGDVGEVISSSASFTNFPTSGQYGDLTSISLTAGDWLVSVQLIQIQNGATVSTVTTGVSTSSGNSSTGLTDGDTQTSAVPQNAAAGAAFVGIMPKRFSLSATTTVYLKYTSSYTVATPQAAGRITAVRIR